MLAKEQAQCEPHNSEIVIPFADTDLHCHMEKLNFAESSLHSQVFSSSYQSEY